MLVLTGIRKYVIKYNMIIAKLLKIITSKPDVIQFAKDRKFEEAWVIELNRPRSTDQEINKYLTKDKFETIIVEYVWNSDDNDKRFVLTLFLNKKCSLKDSKKFIDICLDFFYNYFDLRNFINLIDTQIIGRQYLFINEPDSINLSVFNHWLSVGPVELWQKGDVYNIEEITKRIKSRPEIEKSNLNYQGLFFRFNVKGDSNGPYYGFKAPCCQKKGIEWIINYQKLDY